MSDQPEARHQTSSTFTKALWAISAGVAVLAMALGFVSFLPEGLAVPFALDLLFSR
jgi:hypothetical protein